MMTHTMKECSTLQSISSAHNLPCMMQPAFSCHALGLNTMWTNCSATPWKILVYEENWQNKDFFLVRNCITLSMWSYFITWYAYIICCPDTCLISWSLWSLCCMGLFYKNILPQWVWGLEFTHRDLKVFHLRPMTREISYFNSAFALYNSCASHLVSLPSWESIKPHSPTHSTQVAHQPGAPLTVGHQACSGRLCLLQIHLKQH